MHIFDFHITKLHCSVDISVKEYCHVFKCDLAIISYHKVHCKKLVWKVHSPHVEMITFNK